MKYTFLILCCSTIMFAKGKAHVSRVNCNHSSNINSNLAESVQKDTSSKSNKRDKHTKALDKNLQVQEDKMPALKPDGKYSYPMPTGKNKYILKMKPIEKNSTFSIICGGLVRETTKQKKLIIHNYLRELN